MINIQDDCKSRKFSFTAKYAAEWSDSRGFGANKEEAITELKKAVDEEIGFLQQRIDELRAIDYNQTRNVDGMGTPRPEGWINPYV